jgi:hypothetical protein
MKVEGRMEVEVEGGMLWKNDVHAAADVWGANELELDGPSGGGLDSGEK